MVFGIVESLDERSSLFFPENSAQSPYSIVRLSDSEPAKMRLRRAEAGLISPEPFNGFHGLHARQPNRRVSKKPPVP